MHTVCQLFLTFAHFAHTSLVPSHPGTPAPRGGVGALHPRLSPLGIKFKAYHDSFGISPCIGARCRRARVRRGSVRANTASHISVRISEEEGHLGLESRDGVVSPSSWARALVERPMADAQDDQGSFPAARYRQYRYAHMFDWDSPDDQTGQHQDCCKEEWRQLRR